MTLQDSPELRQPGYTQPERTLNDALLGTNVIPVDFGHLSEPVDTDAIPQEETERTPDSTSETFLDFKEPISPQEIESVRRRNESTRANYQATREAMQALGVEVRGTHGTLVRSNEAAIEREDMTLEARIAYANEAAESMKATIEALREAAIAKAESIHRQRVQKSQKIISLSETLVRGNERADANLGLVLGDDAYKQQQNEHLLNHTIEEINSLCREFEALSIEVDKKEAELGRLQGLADLYTKVHTTLKEDEMKLKVEDRLIRNAVSQNTVARIQIETGTFKLEQASDRVLQLIADAKAAVETPETTRIGQELAKVLSDLGENDANIAMNDSSMQRLEGRLDTVYARLRDIPGLLEEARALLADAKAKAAHLNSRSGDAVEVARELKEINDGRTEPYLAKESERTVLIKPVLSAQLALQAERSAYDGEQVPEYEAPNYNLEILAPLKPSESDQRRLAEIDEQRRKEQDQTDKPTLRSRLPRKLGRKGVRTDYEPLTKEASAEA